MRTIPLIAMALGALALSCGKEDPAATTGTAFTCNVEGSKACTSYSGEGAAAFQENCESGSGVWSTTACATANRCGTCSFTAGGIDYVNSYYKNGPIDKDSLESVCSGLSGTWSDQSGVACD